MIIIVIIIINITINSIIDIIIIIVTIIIIITIIIIMAGIGPALITVPLFWGIYFPIYNNMKSYFNEDHGYKSYAGHVYSAIIAGAVGMI
jgi:hypothetical protein